jgi:hypothetical protein
MSGPLPLRFCVLFLPRQSFLMPFTDMIELARSRFGAARPTTSSPFESRLNRLRWCDGTGGESSIGGEFNATGVCGRRGRGGADPGGGRFAKSNRICSVCIRIRVSDVIGDPPGVVVPGRPEPDACQEGEAWADGVLLGVRFPFLKRIIEHNTANSNSSIDLLGSHTRAKIAQFFRHEQRRVRIRPCTACAQGTVAKHPVMQARRARSIKLGRRGLKNPRRKLCQCLTEPIT